MLGVSLLRSPIADRGALFETNHDPGQGKLAAMSEEIILETVELTKEFAGFVAVSGVNLRIERGTIHALIGPNGAGDHLLQSPDQVSQADQWPDHL
jgi:ATPase subunit of ABC transporter with duplicated ATPase domains